MPERPRVVILDTGSPDQMTGGQSVFIRTLVPHLDADVRLVGATTAPESLGRWRRRLVGGVEVDFMPVARLAPPGETPRVPLRLRCCAGVARFRRRIVDAGDVVYVHSPEMALPLVTGPRRKPVVLHVHGASNPLSVSRYGWAHADVLKESYAVLQRGVVRRSAAVLSVDESGLAKAAAWLPPGSRTRLALVPVCVDERLFRPGDRAAARASAGLASPGPLLLFVGRLELAKGTERLVDALALLAPGLPGLRLAVAGDGSQRRPMEDRARRLGVGDRLLFAGWVDHRALPDWLRAADLLVLPSDTEGLPTVVVEALSCGTPVVATAVGGVPALVTDGVTGLLLKDVSAAALAGAVRDALERRWRRDDLVASVAGFSAERVGRQVDGLLRQAAGR